MKHLVFALLSVALAIAAIVGAFALYLAVSFHTAVAKIDGTAKLPELHGPVTIIRDERDIPHIVAQNEHDLFLAQGYAEGSDRLFQIDLTRHAVYGRLAEWFGTRALSADERSRIVDVRGIVERQFTKLAPRQRAQLVAFSEGINAAMRLQPTPFEYRLLLIRPEPWRPQDSLAVGFATVLVLSDSYRDVFARDQTYNAWSSHFGMPARPGRLEYETYYPLSDPKYDAPTMAALDGHAGSNAWAAGSLHTANRRALLANDPHLAPSIPGIWYVADLRAPAYHAAGASLAGTPGVILGHNDAIAWGATNGSVAAQSVFCGLKPSNADAAHESFRVRFGRSRTLTYFREKRGFYLATQMSPPESCLIAWSAFTNPTSPLETFDGLDRATSIEDARQALSHYPGPTQNFVLAQRDGRVAYQLAGWIPNDPAWARYAHRDGFHNYAILPFKVLPYVAASRNAVVWTANNKMYGKGYPYRLSASFEPPYRAFRIRTLLGSPRKYNVAYFSKMQADIFSTADFEFVRSFVALAHRVPSWIEPAERPLVNVLAGWDGRYDPNSRGATVAHDLRANETISPLTRHDSLTAILQEFRHATAGRWPYPVKYSPLTPAFYCLDRSQGICVRDAPWREAGAVPILHPLHGLGIAWLDGPTLPGDGDKFTIHVQRTTFTQSFRAVWDVGNWDAGGIVIPCGESGEPGSPHYQDLTADWEAHKLISLPFTPRAVQERGKTRQTLTP